MKEAKVGPLASAWQFLQGWKSIIVLIVLVLERFFPMFPGFQYVGLGLSALGWNDVAPAVDPAAAAAALVTLGTVASAGRKAYRQWRAGVPLQYVNSIPPGAVDADLLQTAARVGAKVKDNGGLAVPGGKG